MVDPDESARCPRDEGKGQQQCAIRRRAETNLRNSHHGRRCQQKGFAPDPIADDTGGNGEQPRSDRRQARHQSDEVFLETQPGQIQIVEEGLDRHPREEWHAEQEEAADVGVVFAKIVAAQQVTQ